MIKFTCDSNDGKRKLAGFGLSETNIQKLREGRPIHVHAEEMGLSHDILIFWGTTNEAMEKKFRDHGYIGPDTIIRDEYANPPRKN